MDETEEDLAREEVKEEIRPLKTSGLPSKEMRARLEGAMLEKAQGDSAPRGGKADEALRRMGQHPARLGTRYRIDIMSMVMTIFISKCRYHLSCRKNAMNSDI